MKWDMVRNAKKTSQLIWLVSEKLLILHSVKQSTHG